MKTASIIRTVGVLASLIAALVSYKLLAKHVTGVSGSAWFDAGCPDDAKPGGANCAAVLSSPYSYFPPKKPNEPPNVPHIPVAFLGTVYFSAMAVWLIGVGRPSRRRWWLHALALLAVGFGFAWSCYFIYIMFSRLNEWCPWCIVTHVCNAVLVVCLILMWPSRPRRARAREAEIGQVIGEAPAEARSAAVHPSWSRILTTVGAIIVVTYGHVGANGVLASRNAASTLRQCMDTLARVQVDTQRLVEMWASAPRHPTLLENGDPAGAHASVRPKTIDLVVFSDFQCPSCARFAEFLERDIESLFAGRLNVTFRNYPIDRSCNPVVSTTMHPQACALARLAEAARLQGGDDAFWKVHDLFFERRRTGEEHATIDPMQVAAALGLDAGKLGTELTSAAVTQRISDDIEAARKCNVRDTPAVFLDARRVDPLAVSDLRFWDRVADRFWSDAGEPRPESARRPQAAPTDSRP